MGCDFGKVVAIAAAVTTVVASGGTAASLLAASSTFASDTPLQTDGKPLPPRFEGAAYVVTTLSKVVTTAKEFGDAAQGLAKALEGEARDGVPGLPPDDAKILTSAADLQKQIEPYLNELPEAGSYRKLLTDFVDTCTARNNQVLEYNNALAKIQTLNDEIRQAEVDAARLQDTVALTKDPFLSEVVGVMERAWLDSLATVLEQLVRVHAAYKYFSLKESSTLVLADYSIASLKAANLALWKKYLDEKASAGNAAAVLDRIPVSLLKLENARGLRTLREKNRLTFSLPQDLPAFSRLCKVLVSTVDVNVYSKGRLLRDYSG